MWFTSLHCFQKLVKDNLHKQKLQFAWCDKKFNVQESSVLPLSQSSSLDQIKMESFFILGNLGSLFTGQLLAFFQKLQRGRTLKPQDTHFPCLFLEVQSCGSIVLSHGIRECHGLEGNLKDRLVSIQPLDCCGYLDVGNLTLEQPRTPPKDCLRLTHISHQPRLGTMRDQDIHTLRIFYFVIRSTSSMTQTERTSNIT